MKVSGANNIKNIVIYDVNGRVLQDIKILGNQVSKEINISSLSKGMYLIKIQSDKGVLIEKLAKE